MLRSVKVSFLLIIAELLCGHCNGTASGPASQFCGTTNFYCPVDQMCKPRSERCTASNVCLQDSTGVEDKCDCRGDGKCAVYKGTSPISSSSSSKRSLQQRGIGVSCVGFLFKSRDHEFIDFKGFTYEFGESYGKQILDRNEPLTPYGYKYRRSSDIKSYTLVGYSSCTYEEANEYVNNFYSRYCLCTNNCQDFARGLKRWLVNDNCNRASSRVGRRETSADLSDYFAQISQVPGCRPSSGGTAQNPSFFLLEVMAAAVFLNL